MTERNVTERSVAQKDETQKGASKKPLFQNPLLRVSKNTFALFAGTMSRMVISLGFVIYVARFLGVAGFGKYSLGLLYFDLFLSLSATGLTILITREIARNRASLNRYMNGSIVLAIGLTIISTIILFIIANVFGYAEDTQVAIYLVCLALVPAAIAQILQAVFIAFEQAEYVTYGTILEGLLRAGLGLTVLFAGYGLLALFITLIIVQVCLLTFYLVTLRRQVSGLSWSVEWSFLGQLTREWRVFALENWVSTISSSLGMILLSAIANESVVGLYSAATKVLRLGGIVAKSYTTAIYPYMARLFDESQDGLRQLSEGSLKYMLAFILPIVITITILSDRIILLLYTAEFMEAVPILQVLIWVLLLRFFNPFLSHTLFARGEQQKSLQVAIIMLIFFTVGSLWAIPQWGGLGAAWTRLATSCLGFGLYFMFAMGGETAKQTLFALGRTTAAALSLGAFLWLLRDVQVIPLLIAGGVLYIALLFLLRIVSYRDLQMLQKFR